MDAKHLIALALILIALPMSIAVCCASQRARDAAFFLMGALTALSEKAGVEFLSRYWYRGTTRGFELTAIDILAVGALVSSLLVPRPVRWRGLWPAGLGALLLYFRYSCRSVG